MLNYRQPSIVVEIPTEQSWKIFSLIYDQLCKQEKSEIA